MRTEQQQLNDLKARIQQHNYRYYVLDEPTVPDAEYDRWMRELKAIEAQHPEWITDDSPTQRIGGQAITAFAQVRHAVPMLSLENAFSESDIDNFVRAVNERLATSQEQQIMKQHVQNGQPVKDYVLPS